MKEEIQKDVTITSKGQLTLPVAVRRALNLGARRKVRVAVTKEGTVTLRPLPDVMSLFGVLKGASYDPAEKEKARQAMGRRASRRG